MDSQTAEITQTELRWAEDKYYTQKEFKDYYDQDWEKYWQEASGNTKVRYTVDPTKESSYNVTVTNKRSYETLKKLLTEVKLDKLPWDASIKEPKITFSAGCKLEDIKSYIENENTVSGQLTFKGLGGKNITFEAGKSPNHIGIDLANLDPPNDEPLKCSVTIDGMTFKEGTTVKDIKPILTGKGSVDNTLTSTMESTPINIPKGTKGSTISDVLKSDGTTDIKKHILEGADAEVSDPGVKIDGKTYTGKARDIKYILEGSNGTDKTKNQATVTVDRKKYTIAAGTSRFAFQAVITGRGEISYKQKILAGKNETINNVGVTINRKQYEFQNPSKGLDIKNILEGNDVQISAPGVKIDSKTYTGKASDIKNILEGINKQTSAGVTIEGKTYSGKASDIKNILEGKDKPISAGVTIEGKTYSGKASDIKNILEGINKQTSADVTIEGKTYSGQVNDIQNILEGEDESISADVTVDFNGEQITIKQGTKGDIGKAVLNSGACESDITIILEGKGEPISADVTFDFNGEQITIIQGTTGAFSREVLNSAATAADKNIILAGRGEPIRDDVTVEFNREKIKIKTPTTGQTIKGFLTTVGEISGNLEIEKDTKSYTFQPPSSTTTISNIVNEVNRSIRQAVKVKLGEKDVLFRPKAQIADINRILKGVDEAIEEPVTINLEDRNITIPKGTKVNFISAVLNLVPSTEIKAKILERSEETIGDTVGGQKVTINIGDGDIEIPAGTKGSTISDVQNSNATSAVKKQILEEQVKQEGNIGDAEVTIADNKYSNAKGKDISRILNESDDSIRSDVTINSNKYSVGKGKDISRILKGVDEVIEEPVTINLGDGNITIPQGTNAKVACDVINAGGIAGNKAKILKGVDDAIDGTVIVTMEGSSIYKFQNPLTGANINKILSGADEVINNPVTVNLGDRDIAIPAGKKGSTIKEF